MALSEGLTRQRRALTKFWLAYGKRVVAGGIVVVLALGAFLGYSAWQAGREEATRAGLETAAGGAAKAIAATIDGIVDPLDTALDMPSLSAMAARDDRAGVAAAGEALGSQLPGLLGVRLLRDTDPVPDSDSVPPVTYAALAMLRESKSSDGEPRPEVLLPGKPQEHMAVVRRLTDPSGDVTGHLLLGFDAKPVKGALKDFPLPSGSYVELQQGASKGQSVLSKRGNADARNGPAHVTTAVAGSRLLVAMWPEGAAAGTEGAVSPLMLAGVAALVLAGAAGFVWTRRRKAPKAEDDDRQGALAAAARARVAAERGEQVVSLDDTGPLPTVMVDEGASDEPEMISGELDPTIFRAYDVRGVVGEALSEDVVRLLGLAIGSEAFERGQQTVVVGADGRVSSPRFAAALTEGLRESGRDVIDVGRVPTPVLYFATHFLETGSGVMITGSHNPPNYNGLKIMLAGDTLFGDDIQALRERIMRADFTSGSGNLQSMDVSADYIRRVCEDVPVALGNAFRVVVDCGNGVAGDFAPKLIRALGHDVVELHCEVDGEFPNHHPDPSQPENLRDLIQAIEDEGADLGFAFDGDGDRLGVVDGDGKVIWPDSQMMLFARDVLSRNAGAQIVFDVKCSSRLAKVISRLGGKPVMFKTGHSFIKNKLKETGAPLAGEMSGHIFFKERWYGFDDALYSAARMLEILMGVQASPSEVFAKLPSGVSTPELKVDMAEGENAAFMAALGGGDQFGDGKITTIDGVRVDWDDCWGLVRASNTTPSLVLRFEGDTPEALERVKGIFREVLLAQNASLQLPF